MTGALRAAFRDQAASCADLGSPFMARLCTLLAERLTPGTPLADRLLSWDGDVSSRGASVPLRLCGALHALRLQNRAGLADVYPPHETDPETLWASISHALSSEAAFIDHFLDSPPQTNEVRRSVALLPAAHYVAARFGLPLRLSEMGASAGLNLNFDRFALTTPAGRLGPADAALTLTPDWRGDPPGTAELRIAERRGVDLNPLDPQADALRLLAYLWPDQPHRLALTRAAIGTAHREVDRGDAIDWLTTRLASVPGQTHFIYTTIAWQYFPPRAQARGTALIERAGAMATDNAPIAWFAMEADGERPGAGMTLRLWPGNDTIALGRVDFHGRWIDWRA
ncbi:MAG: hypothetical protein HLUCCA08_09520 [Rhodobacteraceae bacterium HLUCCA08]|nr:MAG: hypothetical protein HLUCCA08_09520 [Rhodobacteraceae bacterium HLUCCA08]